ncbi:SDR family oxidoreductase [Mycobacterium asiaticum]|uniref:SDR family oxidoreductase n=1 Tax=Mycobacterium asiaticum TaxID=1790 RepID=UPI00056517CD|nr:SDR family oxidoreductase [Mycobacterium asiaticum]OBJ54319.1 ABC transporter permease [Mycobacterium asiaticum]ORA18758.1 ABC transporter permease [Mycobacterium asiaticum DSM 44297]
MSTATVVIAPAGELSAALAAGLDAGVIDPTEPELPQADGVVIVVGVDPAAEPLNTLDTDDWDRIVDATMWDTLTALQHARLSVRHAQGRIVLVLPTIGMAGAAGLVAYTTAIEGIRAMAKSASRQWASQGVVVNAVAAPLQLFAPQLAAAANHLSAPALPDDPSIVRSVVEAVKFLLQPHLGHLVGDTIIVDGGSMMLP